MPFYLYFIFEITFIRRLKNVKAVPRVPYRVLYRVWIRSVLHKGLLFWDGGFPLFLGMFPFPPHTHEVGLSTKLASPRLRGSIQTGPK
jgi:hypothetical protein